MRRANISVVLVCLSSFAWSCFDTIGDKCEWMKTCRRPEGGAGGDSSSSGGYSTGGFTTGATGGVSGNGGETNDPGGSGGAGASGGAGGSTAAPDACGDLCAGDAPICDETDASCVECVRTEHCEQGVCDPSTRQCVGCVGSQDCTTPTPHCETSAQICVECLSSKNCSKATASKCVEGTCEACVKDEDCAGVPGKGVCDAGECVECTGTNYAKCGSSNGTRFVCDSLKRECSQTALQSSAGPCKPCVSDAQCKPGQMCVLDKFGSPAENVGYFCHWIQGADAPGVPKDCPTQGRPFVAVQAKVASIDGAQGDICSLRTSTCIALNQFSSTDCSKDGKADDALCGKTPGQDSKCAAYGLGFRCTTTCLSNDDCKTSCDTDATPNICTFQ